MHVDTLQNRLKSSLGGLETPRGADHYLCALCQCLTSTRRCGEQRGREELPCLQLRQGICPSIDSNCSSKSPSGGLTGPDTCPVEMLPSHRGPKAKLASFQRDLLAKLPCWSQDHPAHLAWRSMSGWIKLLNPKPQTHKTSEWLTLWDELDLPPTRARQLSKSRP